MGWQDSAQAGFINQPQQQDATQSAPPQAAPTPDPSQQLPPAAMQTIARAATPVGAQQQPVPTAPANNNDSGGSWKDSAIPGHLEGAKAGNDLGSPPDDKTDIANMPQPQKTTEQGVFNGSAGFLDSMVAAQQRTSPIVRDLKGNLNYQLIGNDVGESDSRSGYSFTGKDGSSQNFDPQNQVMLRDPTDGKMYVYKRSPDTNESALPALGRMLGIGAMAGPVAGPTAGAVDTAAQAATEAPKPTGSGVPLVPPVAPEFADVAQKARDFGIPLSVDQVTKNPVLQNIQKVTQELPFSGQTAFRNQQMKAWNKALFNTVGMDADSFTPSNMDAAFTKVGNQFDNLTSGKTFDVGGQFLQDTSATADQVESQYGTEARQIFEKEAGKVMDDFGVGDGVGGDQISGDLLGLQRARINALARGASPGNADALRSLENNIMDSITSNDPETQAALSTAKNQYKNLIAIEPLANKAKGGNISPTQLNSRVNQIYGRAATRGQAGDIGDLAKIGYELLPELGGSDTTQKMLTAGALTGAAANPASIPFTAGASAAGRVYQSAFNRNQGLVDALLQRKPGALQQVSQLPPDQAQDVLQQVMQKMAPAAAAQNYPGGNQQ